MFHESNKVFQNHKSTWIHNTIHYSIVSFFFVPPLKQLYSWLNLNKLLLYHVETTFLVPVISCGIKSKSTSVVLNLETEAIKRWRNQHISLAVHWCFCATSIVMWTLCPSMHYSGFFTVSHMSFLYCTVLQRYWDKITAMFPILKGKWWNCWTMLRDISLSSQIFSSFHFWSGDGWVLSLWTSWFVVHPFLLVWHIQSILLRTWQMAIITMKWWSAHHNTMKTPHLTWQNERAQWKHNELK